MLQNWNQNFETILFDQKKLSIQKLVSSKRPETILKNWAIVFAYISLSLTVVCHKTLNLKLFLSVLHFVGRSLKLLQKKKGRKQSEEKKLRNVISLPKKVDAQKSLWKWKKKLCQIYHAFHKVWIRALNPEEIE